MSRSITDEPQTKTTGDALRLAATFLFELRNSVQLYTFERLMRMQAELTKLAAEVEDPHETPYDWSPTRPWRDEDG